MSVTLVSPGASASPFPSDATRVHPPPWLELSHAAEVLLHRSASRLDLSLPNGYRPCHTPPRQQATSPCLSQICPAGSTTVPRANSPWLPHITCRPSNLQMPLSLPAKYFSDLPLPLPHSHRHDRNSRLDRPFPGEGFRHFRCRKGVRRKHECRERFQRTTPGPDGTLAVNMN